MVRCQVCGKDEQMPYRCSYCRKPHCGEHRLPEAHMCPEKHMAAAARRQRELTGDPGIEIRNRTHGRAGAGRGSRGGGWWARSLGALDGKVALYTLGLIVAVWVLELVVLSVLGLEAFTRIFVLDETWVTKPWTLVTSIFAHAPGTIGHLLFNGLFLFFFGPLLERRIGSRRFLGLLLGGGILAGLAQITFTELLGVTRGVVGLSGGLMAVMGTLTILGPRLTVLLFFVVPTPLWILTIGYAALTMLGVFGAPGGGGGIAHMAHLAGLVVGLAAGWRLRGEGFKFPGRQGQLDLGPSGGW